MMTKICKMFGIQVKKKWCRKPNLLPYNLSYATICHKIKLDCLCSCRTWTESLDLSFLLIKTWSGTEKYRLRFIMWLAAFLLFEILSSRLHTDEINFLRCDVWWTCSLRCLYTFRYACSEQKKKCIFSILGIKYKYMDQVMGIVFFFLTGKLHGCEYEYTKTTHPPLNCCS